MVGVCLRFKYLMPTKSNSYLKVMLWETIEKREVLVWQLLGYHGQGWSVAQVVLPSSVAVQVSEASFSFEWSLFLLAYIYACDSLETLCLVVDNIIFCPFLFVIVLWQVMFEGGGFADDLVNVAIDDVSVKTENCVLLPYYAKPGYFYFLFFLSFHPYSWQIEKPWLCSLLL